jgi:hypothetical protein
MLLIGNNKNIDDKRIIKGIAILTCLDRAQNLTAISSAYKNL